MFTTKAPTAKHMSELDMAVVDTIPRSTFSRFTPFGRRNSESGSVGNSPTLTAPFTRYLDTTVPVAAATPRFTLESLAAELELLSTSPTGGFSYLSGELYNTAASSRVPLTKSRSVPSVLNDSHDRATALVPLRKAKSVRFADSQGLPLIEAVYELSKQDSSYTANKIVPYSDDLSASIQLTTGRGKSLVSATSTTPASTQLSELTVNTTTILKTTQSSPIVAASPLSPPTPPHRHRLGFTQPCLEPDFFHRVNKHYVVLDNVREEIRSLQGTIRVANLCYEKEVVIRWTHDNWRSSHDTKAVFCANDGATDRFTFEIPINGDDVVFCIRYKTDNQEYWDNNHGSNYTVFSE